MKTEAKKEKSRNKKEPANVTKKILILVLFLLKKQKLNIKSKKSYKYTLRFLLSNTQVDY